MKKGQNLFTKACILVPLLSEKLYNEKQTHNYLVCLAKREKSQGNRRGAERRKCGGNIRLKRKKKEERNIGRKRAAEKEKREWQRGREGKGGIREAERNWEWEREEAGLRREGKTKNKELQQKPGEVSWVPFFILQIFIAYPLCARHSDIVISWEKQIWITLLHKEFIISFL